MFKRAYFVPAILLAMGCAQSQKDSLNDISRTEAVQRGVASPQPATDFVPDREHFDGSAGSLTRHLKSMRGVGERADVMNIATKREVLLHDNLFDTGSDGAKLDCKKTMAMGREDFLLHHRTPEGTCYMYKQGQFMTAKSEADLSGLDKMGSKGARFGRNSGPLTPEEISKAEANVDSPNPIEVSKTFFSRKKELAKDSDGFQPVPWVNLLASAWLQAQNHDWFSHGKNVDMSHLSADLREKYAKAFAPYNFEFNGEKFMIPRTRPDMSALQGLYPGQKYEKGAGPKPLENAGHKYGRKYRNAVTHWWDASHIYGSDAETNKIVRSIPSGETYTDKNGKIYQAGEIYPDGKIAVDEKNKKLFYRVDPDHANQLLPITGFHDNWWIGLEMIHTVFALEHNQIATKLKQEFESKRLICAKPNPACSGAHQMYFSFADDPAKQGDFVFNKARLVLSALIAKIHTVEWTPAILDNPGLRMGMFANWNGLKTAIGDIESPMLRKALENTRGQESRALVSGLIGAGTLNLYKVPFTLTEEFVSVYRMHPLLSDNINVLKADTHGKDVTQKSISIDETRDGKVNALLGKNSSTEWMYSFGRNRAGLMTLHNYPKFMENIEIHRNVQGQGAESIKMNMGAVDIVRDRERQTPRYNAFRRMMHMRPLKRFEELFVTSKILYEDNSARSNDYKRVIENLSAQVRKAKYDLIKIERDADKIENFNVAKAGHNVFKGFRKGGLAGGKSGFLTDGKTLISEEEFYKLYFQLSQADQEVLLTKQEIQDIADMKRLYKEDVELLDLLVGTLAEEDRFDMFGFGNTPFYVFALMASRRLMTDPFLSDLYTADVYTKVGLDWVEKQTMVDVIKRNFPDLETKFNSVNNAFHPWNPN